MTDRQNETIDITQLPVAEEAQRIPQGELNVEYLNRISLLERQVTDMSENMARMVNIMDELVERTRPQPQPQPSDDLYPASKLSQCRQQIRPTIPVPFPYESPSVVPEYAPTAPPAGYRVNVTERVLNIQGKNFSSYQDIFNDPATFRNPALSWVGECAATSDSIDYPWTMFVDNVMRHFAIMQSNNSPLSPGDSPMSGLCTPSRNYMTVSEALSRVTDYEVEMGEPRHWYRRLLGL
jgi:hypothetical protein